MSSSTVPLPPPSALIDAIRSSSHDLRVKSKIEINQDSINTFLSEIKEEEWEAEMAKGDQGIRMPLRFESDLEELNVISILSLLNFLSGYRTPLHRLTSQGAWSNILTLVLSAHLSSALLTTPQMLLATPHSIAGLLQIKTHQEKPHPTLGSAIMVGEKDEEAWEILELLCGVLRETGGILKKEEKESLGEWMAEALTETGADEGEMLVKLADTFPAFRDCIAVDGEPVYFFKKALFLLHSIHLRFSSSDSPSPFPIPKHTSTFPIFADNIIPTMLLHHSLLDFSSSIDPSLASSSPSSTPLSHASAARLRAASVDCCFEIVKRAREIGKADGKGWLEEMTEVQLDRWLWALGKKGDLREVTRFEERGTVFY